LEADEPDDAAELSPEQDASQMHEVAERLRHGVWMVARQRRHPPDDQAADETIDGG
jgi:hypothetical protein